MKLTIHSMMVEINNGYRAGHGQVRIKYTKTRYNMLKKLQELGLIGGVIMVNNGLLVSLQNKSKGFLLPIYRQHHKQGQAFTYKELQRLVQQHGGGVIIVSTYRGLETALEVVMRGEGGVVELVI